MIIKYDNKAVKYTNKWVSIGGITPPPVPTVYSVHTVSSTGGSVSAVPNSGISGTEVTLSNTPATNYTFSSYSVTGATLKNSNQFNIGSSDVYVKGNFTYSDPYNPLNLPANTMRLRFTDGYTPTAPSGSTYTQVSSSPNIWDLTREPQMTSWVALFRNNTNVLEVLGANTSTVTDMSAIFQDCIFLSSVAIFNTSNITDMSYMFRACNILRSIPLFDTSKVSNMSYMFFNCYDVQSGALALYQQASTQANPPSNHTYTFYNCGATSTTGAAELAQIPSDWK